MFYITAFLICIKINSSEMGSRKDWELMDTHIKFENINIGGVGTLI